MITIFSKINFNHIKIFELITLFLLILFFHKNISNVGGTGSGLFLLLMFFSLNFSLRFYQGIKYGLIIKIHLFIFLLFISWIALRIILDLGDIEHLKQVTIATTSGIILFFLMGSFLRVSLNYLLISRGGFSIYYISLISIFCFMCYTNYSLFERLERNDVFLIEGLNSGYQRAGNFLIINYIIFSFFYVSLLSKDNIVNLFKILFIIFIYSSGSFLSLISSQMIGSNAATANILAIYLMTMVVSFLGFNRKIRSIFREKGIVFSLHKLIISKGIKFSFFLLLVLIFLGFVFVSTSGFDINKTRILGFGEYENNSISSRIDIIKRTGLEQMGYSPILGDINVAYLTTGDAGLTLHNFLPNIISELGVVGIVFFSIFLFFIFTDLIKNLNFSIIRVLDFNKYIINLWLIAVIVFFLVYANFSVGKEWSVIWFYLGFVVSSFYVKRINC